MICTMLSLLFDRYVQQCINFRFEICTDNLPMIKQTLSSQFAKFFWKCLIRKFFKTRLTMHSYRFMHNKHGNLMWLYVFLFIIYQNECNNFSKSSLWKALHRINLILWFFGFKTCKDISYVNKLKLFITTNPEDQLWRFSIKPVTVGWFWSQRPYFCT